jgi:hypothetical protein
VYYTTLGGRRVRRFFESPRRRGLPLEVIVVKSGHAVDGVRIIFMRVKESRLDLNDCYGNDKTNELFVLKTVDFPNRSTA